MIAIGKREIRDGLQYDPLFPSVSGKWVTVKKKADLEDTVNLMKKVLWSTLADTKQIAKKLKRESVRETCRRIWNWCYNHIQYKQDEDGKEQIRRPARSWWDRKSGVDCDCYSVLIGSILTNLGIPFLWRLTRYTQQNYEHVYPIALADNRTIIMDCVIDKFDTEVPYTEKKDIKMELQYLNGIEVNLNELLNEIEDEAGRDPQLNLESDLPIDAIDMLDGLDLEGLEGKAERKARRAARKAKRQAKGPLKERIKKAVKKGVHTINRVNPTTTILRVGILASMKLNVMKVASKLRFAYWSPEEARRQNMDLAKYNQLVRIREKVEKAFFAAGGKPENLKKAILTGRGNLNHQVQLNGLGAVGYIPTDDDDLKTILGEDLYNDEAGDIATGINGLGAVSAAAIAAASGLIGSIAAFLKQLGSLFKKGSAQAKKEKEQDAADDKEDKTRKFSTATLLSNLKNNIQVQKLRSSGTDTGTTTITQDAGGDLQDFMILPGSSGGSGTYDMVTDVADNTGTDNSSGGSDKKGIVDWIKEHPVATGAIAAGAIGGTVLLVHALKKPKTGSSVNGLGRVTKASKKKKKSTGKSSSKRKSGARRKTSTSAKKRTVKKGRTTRRSKPRTTRVKKVELL